MPAPLDECGRWTADSGPFVPPILDELTGRGETSSLSRAGLISRPVVEGGDIGPFVPSTLDGLTGRGETSSLSRAGWVPRSVVDGGAGTCGRRTVDVCFLLLLAI